MTIAACDTETTGLDLRHGCRPFMFGGMDEHGRVHRWRWRINPFTREVDVPNSEKVEVHDYLSSFDRIIWWNAKYDLTGLILLGIPLPKDIWDRSEDGIIANHCLWSGGPHDLKTQAMKHLDILDDDEEDLRTATLRARTIGKNLGWRIAEAEDPHWPTMKSGESWWKCDYWMPGELYRLAGTTIIDEQGNDRLVVEDDRIIKEWEGICEVYHGKDLERTFGMWLTLREMLKNENLWDRYEVRRNLLRVTYEMESRGLTVRKFLIPGVRQKHANLAEKHQENCFRAVNHSITNLESTKQLQVALYTTLGLPVLKRTEKSSLPSTDKDTLEALKDECRPASPAGWFLTHLAAYRKRDHAAETVGTYERGCFPYFDHNGKENNYFGILMPTVNITGTRETRCSSNNPNGQNIAKGEGLPKEEKFNLRDLFGPPPGRLWYSHDYSNIEMRIFAYLAGEQSFLDAFAAGESVHLLVCKELYPDIFDEDFRDKYPHLYQWVKNGNFSLIYGAGWKRADATYHFPGAYRIVRKKFKQIDRFMSLTQKEASQTGYVTTLGGYRLQVTEGAHKAVNYKVQGSAGWAMCLAMVRIRKYLDTLDDYHMIMQIHDELLHDVPQAHSEVFPYRIKELMERSGDDLGLALPVEMSRIRVSWDKDEDVPPLQLKSPLTPLAI